MQKLINLFKRKEVGFPNLVPYFMLAGEGVLLTKDGSFMTSFYYRPPDMAASSSHEKEALARYINEVLSMLGTGWFIHVDLIKLPVGAYGLGEAFPDPMLLVLELERRVNFETKGGHFEIIYAVTLTYKPPALLDNKYQRLFISNSSNEKLSSGMSPLLKEFLQTTSEIESALGNYVAIRRMSSKELLEYLHYCITGRFVALKVPERPVFLNHLLGSYDFAGGLSPRIDDKNIGIVAMIGFPQTSFSGILEFLQSLPFEFRFSSRFIFLDPVDAEQHLRRVLIKWHNKQISLRDLVLETVAPGAQSQYGNMEAANKSIDAHQCITLAQEATVRFGYYTAIIGVMCEDKKECQKRLELLRDALRANSFPARIETVNAIEAYLGSLPGNHQSNVRRPLIHTLNLSHIIPIQGIWTGQAVNPNPKLPVNSPPLLMASTTGGVPFHFNNYVEDVGHTFICGPTGSGKSTLLALIATQFLRYQNTQVFFFDRKYGFYALSEAVAAEHYDIMADDNSLTFCPLQQIEDKSELMWAAQWLEQLISLQGVAITPEKRQAILEGLEALKADKIKSLTNFYLSIQDREIRMALEPFTSVKNGVMAGLMDGNNDTLLEGYLQVFEMGKLLDAEHRYSAPVLLYLFHQISRRLDGRPTMIVIDETWRILDDPLFVRHLKEYLRELRRANGCVVFCSQHVSDFLDSPIKDVIIESTPVKIYLPNSQAGTPAEEQSYLKLGLTRTDVEFISGSTSQKHYYYTSLLGKRLIDLELGPVFLSFMGRNNVEDIRRIKELKQRFLDKWPAEYLRTNNLEQHAQLLEEIYKTRKETVPNEK